MKLRVLLVVPLLLTSFTLGCSEPQSKMADKPTDEQVRAFQKAEKDVEAEERGTPIVPAKKPNGK